jgi:Flp pilus assembly protein TadG
MPADERGQALVEFTLVLPLLLALVTAITQFGLAYNHYVTLTDASRAGARAGAVSDDAVAAAKDAAVKSAGGLLTNADVQATVANGDITVTTTRQETISIFGFAVVTPTLRSTTTERVEQ